MPRVLAPLLVALCVAAAIPPAASAAKAKSCGTVTVFNNKFRLTAKGPGCSFARSTVRKFERVSGQLGCGSFVGGPCEVNGYECLTTDGRTFRCVRGSRSIVARRGS